jgi:hypothetical protein
MTRYRAMLLVMFVVAAVLALATWALCNRQVIRYWLGM